MIARLVALGAEPPAGDRSRWLASSLDRIGARRLRHPGNHRYIFRLGRRVELGMATAPYPKDDQTEVCA